MCILGGHTGGHIPVHTHGDQRKTLIYHAVFSLETRSLVRPGTHHFSARLTGSEPQQSSCLCQHLALPEPHITDACSHTTLFVRGCSGSVPMPSCIYSKHFYPLSQPRSHFSNGFYNPESAGVARCWIFC